MSKKSNTFLFILGGTVFNVLVTLLIFILFLVIYSQFNALLPENTAAWMLPVIFVAAIVASFFIYRLTVKLIMKKVDFEKHFDPIFGPRRPTRKP